jgi:hypothetical protein
VATSAFGQSSRRSKKSEAAPPPKPQLTLAQLSEIQTREFSADFDVAYRATVAVLLERGWQLEATDKEAGLIQATSLHTQDVIGPNRDDLRDHPEIGEAREAMRSFRGSEDMSFPTWTRWERLTVLLEPWGSGAIRGRISIVKRGSLASGMHYYPNPSIFGYKGKKILDSGQEQSVMVADPKSYEVLFQSIEQAISIRAGLGGRF